MIDINFCIKYAQRLQNAIAAINYNEVVTDPSQIHTLLQPRTKADQFMLFFAIPDFQTVGRNIDNLTEEVSCAILILQKTAYADMKHADYLKLMQDTLVAAREVKFAMVNDKANYDADGCSYMKQLNVDSIRIVPELHLAECNGWSVEFSFDNSE